MCKNGRWVIDDYYEDKARAECEERGAKPGDEVGEVEFVGGPSAGQSQVQGELAGLLGSGSGGAGGGGAGGGAGGVGGSIYRPGGPTTIFGGSGWGPYSDGPLNAVRKSVLSR